MNGNPAHVIQIQLKAFSCRISRRESCFCVQKDTETWLPGGNGAYRWQCRSWDRRPAPAADTSSARRPFRCPPPTDARTGRWTCGTGRWRRRSCPVGWTWGWGRERGAARWSLGLSSGRPAEGSSGSRARPRANEAPTQTDDFRAPIYKLYSILLLK